MQQWVRGRLVHRLESMTGGRVELGDLTWRLYGLHVNVTDLTIHGREVPGEAPYFHADQINLRLKIVAALGAEIGLRELQVERPVVHLIIQPDGRSNQPLPAAAISQTSRADDVWQLFALAIDHATVRDGHIVVNERVIPLDISAENVAMRLNYARRDNRYDIKLAATTINSAYARHGGLASSLQADLSLFTTEAEFKSVKWNAGNSWVDLSGKLVNYSDPRITLQYLGQADLALLAPISGIRNVPRGTLQFQGLGSWSAASGPLADGKLLLKNADFHSPELQLLAVTAGAQYKVTPKAITLSQVFASLLGGTARGTIEIRDWLPSKNPSTGSATFELRRAVAEQLLSAPSAPRPFVSRLKIRGSVEGTVKLSWKGSPSNMVAEFDVGIVPLPASADEMPLSARLRGSYSVPHESFQIGNAEFDARSMSVQLTGVRSAATSDLRIAARAGELRDIAPLLGLLQPRQILPPGVTGQGQFAGAITGRTDATEIAGALELRNLAVPIEALKNVQLPSSATGFARFDLLSGNIRYSPRSLQINNGIIRSGAEQVNVAGSIGLDRGRMTPDSPLMLKLGIHNADAAALLALIGHSYPITGTVNADLNVIGTRAYPQGGGAIHLTNATMWRLPVSNADAIMDFRNRVLEISSLVLTSRRARLVGGGTYNFATTDFGFNLQGINLDLQQLPRTSKFGAVGGTVNFTLSAYGTREEPVVNGAVRVDGLVLGGEPVGSMTIQAVTVADTLRLTGRSNFRDESFALDGTVVLRDRLPARLDVHFNHLDVDSLLQAVVRGRLTGHSATTGTLTVDGPLRQPERLSVVLHVEEFTASLDRVRLNNQGPIRIVIRNDVAQIEQLHLVGTETDLSAIGSVNLAGHQEVKIDADGQINMVLFQSLDPDVHSAGTVRFRLAVGGVLARPTLNGEVNVSKGAFALINFPNGLSDINGTLVFNQDRLQVQKLTAQTGGGQIEIAGFLTYGKVVGFNLTATGKDIRFRYQGVSSTGNADLRLTGNVQNALLSGDITVTKFSMGPQFDLAYLLNLSRTPTPQVLPGSPLNNWHNDVHIHSSPELEVQSSLAKLTGNIDLTLRGNAAHPALLGRITVASGKVNFNGTNYDVPRGEVTFTNPVRIEPIIDVELTTRVRDYDITLGFHGPTDRLSTTYRSEPPLQTSDIISLLAFGQTLSETAVNNQPTAFTETASNAIIAQALNATVSDRVQKLFGASRIKIAPDVTSTFANPNTQVSIEQQVNKNITLTYITSLTQSAQQIIQVEYNINRNLSIIAVRDQFGVLAFDVRMRKRKR